MNKNYIFVLGIVVIVIAIIGFVVLYQLPLITLDQIIKNKDCAALEKWENKHMFDDDLNVSPEQLSAAIKLAAECVGKVVGNMFGNSDLSTDTTDPIVILDEILNKGDCEGVEDWGIDHIIINKDVILNSKQQSDINKLALECADKEFENFLRESDVSTNTTDPMIVLGKILNKKNCDGLEDWLNKYRESDVYKDMRAPIKIEVWDFERVCNIR